MSNRRTVHCPPAGNLRPPYWAEQAGRAFGRPLDKEPRRAAGAKSDDKGTECAELATHAQTDLASNCEWIATAMRPFGRPRA